MEENIEYLKWQLVNVLKGDALRIKEDKQKSPEKELEQLRYIEAMKNYIENYEKNIEFIQNEKEQALRMEDDGR